MDKCFISKVHVPCVTRFTSKFRFALMNLGKSPDMHLYNIDEQSMGYSRISEDYRFVMSVVDFYNKLENSIKKRIFLTEFVERGRHYPFWHYEMLDTSVYRQMVEEVYQEFAKTFVEESQ